MTKNILVIYSFLLFTVVSCGENSTGYNNSAGNCQPGYSWNGSSCILNNTNINGYNTGLNGFNNGVNPSTPITLPAQGCTTGYIWNGTTCIPTQNTTSPHIALAPTQNCSAGQYFNGADCAATVNFQGSCGTGQINTFSYGCVQPASQCQNQYSYLNGSSCIPTQITLSDCRATKVRRNGRVFMMRNQCPNDCSGNYGGTPKKIKFYRDGSIKKIKW